MGVYYYFVNTRTNSTNEQPIPGYNLHFIAKFDGEEETFKAVLSVNPDWLPTDVIKAYPDYPYYSIYVYNNDVVTVEGYDEENM
jgi:hypothetical protein